VSQSGSVSGGPVDHVFTRLRDLIADVSVERLRVKHVSVDDDNLWFTR